jgi:hypothetical protein
VSKESDAIDQVFKIHEDAKKERTHSQKLDQIRVGTSHLTREEMAWADEAEAEKQDGPSEPYHPIQRREDTRSGCLGGVLYAVFILCVSIVLACFAWMAASDALALNQESFTATVTLPTSAFETKTVDVFDEDGAERKVLVFSSQTSGYKAMISARTVTFDNAQYTGEKAADDWFRGFGPQPTAEDLQDPVLRMVLKVDETM